jgi:hypothetical protein
MATQENREGASRKNVVENSAVSPSFSTSAYDVYGRGSSNKVVIPRTKRADSGNMTRCAEKLAGS